MAINETQLNGRVATLLDRMNVRWDVHAEMKGAFVNAQTQPDILGVAKRRFFGWFGSGDRE